MVLFEQLKYLKMASKSSVSAQDVLKINPEDISGSWRRWYNGFKLKVKLRKLDMGFDTVQDGDNVVRVPKFTDAHQVLMLLNAIGTEGQEVLVASGIDIDDDETNYKVLVDALVAHYQREESLYIRLRKFVTVRQCAGEDSRDYLKRVERLSRDLDFFKSDNADTMAALQTARKSLAMMLAVTGLRDQQLCKELIAKNDLTWGQLSNISKCVSTAKESIDKLGTSMKAVSIKSEPVDEVRVQDTSTREVSRVEHNRGSRRRDSRSRSRSFDRHRGHGSGYNSHGRGRSRSGSWSRDQHRSRNQHRGSRDHHKGSRDNGTTMRCHECNSSSHIARFCPRIICYKCRGRGHQARDCGVDMDGRSREYSRSPDNRRDPTPHRPEYSRGGSRSPDRRVQFVSRVKDEYSDSDE